MDFYKESEMILVDVDDDDTYGYVVSKHPTLGFMYTLVWHKDAERKLKSIYNSPERMYERAQEHLKSMLVDYSPLHTAETIMYKAYVQFYESNLFRPRTP